VLALDATGLDALEDLMEKLRKHKKELILCAPHSQPLFAMVKAGFLDRIGRQNVCANVDESLNRARQLLGQKSPTQTGAHLKT
jgi:SulP family sulfate permease